MTDTAKIVQIREMKEPLYPSGLKFAAYTYHGFPMYMARETKEALKLEVLRYKPDAIFIDLDLDLEAAH